MLGWLSKWLSSIRGGHWIFVTKDGWIKVTCTRGKSEGDRCKKVSVRNNAQFVLCTICGKWVGIKRRKLCTWVRESGDSISDS
jgi:hypothetical protein